MDSTVLEREAIRTEYFEIQACLKSLELRPQAEDREKQAREWHCGNAIQADLGPAMPRTNYESEDRMI